MKRFPPHQPPAAGRRRPVKGFDGYLDEKSDDTTWALALLKGYLQYPGGTWVPRHKYIEGGKEEHKARMALFRVLLTAEALMSKETDGEEIATAFRKLQLAEVEGDRLAATKEAVQLLHKRACKDVLRELALMAAPALTHADRMSLRQFALSTPELSAMLGPTTPSFGNSDRKLTFSRRVKQSHHYRNNVVFHLVEEKLIDWIADPPSRIKGVSVEKACAEVADKTGLSVDTVIAIWKERGGLVLRPRSARKRGI